MGTRQAKQIRKQIKKQSPEIKTQGLKEFMEFAINQSLKKRIVFALRVVFRRLL